MLHNMRVLVVGGEWLGDELIIIPKFESYVHTLGLSFQTNTTISHDPYQAFSLLNSPYSR